MFRSLLSASFAFAVLVASCLASPTHVDGFGYAGGSLWAGSFSGSVSGNPELSRGSGSIDSDFMGTGIAEASLPLGVFSLDLSYVPFKFQSKASGNFAFNGERFNGRAGIDFRADTFETILRWRIIQRPRMSFNLMAGARYLSTDVELFGVDFRTVATDTMALPSVGSSLHLSLDHQLLVFGTFKYFSRGRSGRDDGFDRTLDASLGVLYHFLPKKRFADGVRGSIGYRILEMESGARLGEQDQADFDVRMAGPFASILTVF